jgi:hypothetical protein
MIIFSAPPSIKTVHQGVAEGGCAAYSFWGLKGGGLIAKKILDM